MKFVERFKELLELLNKEKLCEDCVKRCGISGGDFTCETYECGMCEQKKCNRHMLWIRSDNEVRICKPCLELYIAEDAKCKA